jgi:hypothetical protein
MIVDPSAIRAKAFTPGAMYVFSGVSVPDTGAVLLDPAVELPSALLAVTRTSRL